LPIPSLVQVTNLANGKEVILRVNDRGPFVQGRLIDVSRRAAEVLGFVQDGHAEVHVRYLGPAPKRVDSATGAATPAPSAAPLAQPSGAPLIVTSAPPAAPRAQSGGAGPAYVVQIGAFSDFANAERARAALRNAGVVTIDTRQTERGAVHRVRLGPWGDRGAAESARSAAVARGYGDAVVSGLK
jgi:rare lipoprotein A